MFVFSRPAGTVADERVPWSSPEWMLRSCVAGFHRPDRKTICQWFGLAWVVAAIVACPVYQANRDREARRAVRLMGGRYNIGRNALVDALPASLANWIGGETLYPVRSINLSHCDVTDDDLAVLLDLRSLEQVNLCGCGRVTTEAAARLWRLPRMKLVWVDGMSIEDAGHCLLGEPMAAAGD